MSKPKKGKRFVYSLETLVTVREIREKQAQDAYKEAERILMEECRKEQELKDLQQHHYQEYVEKMKGGYVPDMNDIKRRKRQIEVLYEKIEEQAKVREEAETKKEEAQEKLIQAVKEKKIIEKDKEKTREAWRKLMDKEDAKFLDDIATIGYEKQRRDKEELDNRKEENQ